MNEKREELRLQRILVALDASPHSLAALNAAADLASQFKAELQGLFVEDENLLRLVNMPFLREIGLFTAASRHLSREELRRQIRWQGRRARQVFTITTRQANLKVSFRVSRGMVLSEVMAAASEADMLVLGSAGWSMLRHRRLGSTVRGILPQRFGLALVMREGTAISPPFAVAYDGSPSADRALLTAEILARRLFGSQTLIVLILAEDRQRVAKLQERAEARLEERNVKGHYRHLKKANVLLLGDLLQAEQCGTLVLPAQSSALQSEVLVTLLEQLQLPTLLVT